MKICPHCHNEIKPENFDGAKMFKRATFCSMECYRKHKAKKIYDKTCENCEAQFRTDIPGKKFCSIRCQYLASRKNGHRYIAGQGYYYVKINCQYHLEHRIVMEKKLGRKLLPNEQCHHINGVKTDNRPENLALFNSNSEHIKFHYDECIRKGIPAPFNRPETIRKRWETRRKNDNFRLL